MLFLLIIFLSHTIFNDAVILHCDFETDCVDFTFDSNWGLTDGQHSQGIDHDHTLNTSAGHYRFYNPQFTPQIQWAQIQTTNSLQGSADRTLCFHMWYYTPRSNFPFNVHVGQGDDGQLTHVLFSTAGQNASTNDWTLINVTLPNEELKIFIRLNVTTQPLTFDDFSVDYCDGPHTLPPKVLYSCDFESSCTNDFISFSQYRYQWSILNASDAVKIEKEAPAVDYTFGNASGHYALLHNVSRGVGYLHAQRELQITSNESYCLNFRYYGTDGPNHQSYLTIYSWASNESNIVQKLWPVGEPYNYRYMVNQWTWGVINLPIGNYSLLFRVFNGDFYSSTLSLDNIAIVSCDYPSSQPSPSLLSFSCDFDDSTMCGMSNAATSSKTAFNFTLSTGDTLPNKDLGPARDHTTNSTSGGFLYWNRQFPFTSTDSGRILTSVVIVPNFDMCVKFAYYIKSTSINKNGTTITVSSRGCITTIIWPLWSISLDDSQGWQTVIVPVTDYMCEKIFSFDISQTQSVGVSVAFDDIETDQCSTFVPTTTTTTTEAPTMITTTTSTISSSSTIITTTSPSTTSTSTSVRTTPSNAHRRVFLNRYSLITICFLPIIFRKYFY